MPETATDSPPTTELPRRADLEDGAELAVLIATRPVEVVVAHLMLFIVATGGLVIAGFQVDHVAGWVAIAGAAAAYAAAVSRVSDAMSPRGLEAETARRLASDVVVTRDGQYELTQAGRRKVAAYRRQVPEAAMRRRCRRLRAGVARRRRTV